MIDLNESNILKNAYHSIFEIVLEFRVVDTLLYPVLMQNLLISLFLFQV